MSSGFKKRLTRLHASRQRLRRSEHSGAEGESRVFFADDEADAQDGTSDTRMAENKTPRAAQDAPDLWAQVGAKVQKSARGDAYYLQREHPADSAHGRWQLGQGREVKINAFHAKFPALFDGEQTRTLPRISPSDLAFVDLETNGLSKQSYPFCVGIGLWEEDIFSVYHFLMRSPEDEPAVLSASVELLQKARGLCTFNGASFDVPMLKRRCELHGIAHPFDTLPHLDLLRFSRKINKDRRKHALSRLEEDLLNFRRVDDVPGAQIPPLWKRYLKAKNPRPLLGIFEHNRLDILSMVVLFPELAQAINPPQRPEEPRPAPAKRAATASATAMNQRLARAYALRNKTQTKSPRRGDRAAPKPQSAPQNTTLAPAFSRAELNQGMPIGGRLRLLRAQVEDALASPAGADTAELLPRLHEMLALAPRHPFALEKLVDHYHQTQQPALAKHFEKRLKGVSPF